MRLIPICLLMLFAPLALAACDDGEEGLGAGGDDTGDTPAEEVLDEILRAGASIDNLRTEGIYISGFDGSGQGEGGLGVDYGVSIDAADAQYSRSASVPAQEFSTRCGGTPDGACLRDLLEFCQAAETNCPTHDFFGESLWVGDILYHRLDDGTWSDSESAGCGYEAICVSERIEIESCAGVEELEDNTAAMLLSIIEEAVVVGDAPEGEIHIRGKAIDPFNFDWPDACGSPEPTLPTVTAPFPPEFADGLAEKLGLIPNRAGGTVDIWVDADTYFPLRQEDHSTYFHDDEIVGESHSIAVFSDYNTAEIPGPLPY